MNKPQVDDIANAVLYEGYLLYPYRASAVKNRKRWNFGVIYPPGRSEASLMQTECLIRAPSEQRGPFLGTRLRFLQLIDRSSGSDPSEAWQEGREREVSLPPTNLPELIADPMKRTFHFSGEHPRECLSGELQAEASEIIPGLFKIRIQIRNTGAARPGESHDDSLLRSLVSAHTILDIKGGNFISLLDPPAELAAEAALCKNVGTYPVLVGEEGQRDTMLSSPIILYDYPRIAPESAGPLFDGTEIDEILTLRVMTLTDAEKAEMAATDERARQILERTESMPPEQLMKMHGALRSLPKGGAGRAK